jgi:hypothetical protein
LHLKPMLAYKQSFYNRMAVISVFDGNVCRIQIFYLLRKVKISRMKRGIKPLLL